MHVMSDALAFLSSGGFVDLTKSQVMPLSDGPMVFYLVAVQCIGV